MFGGLCCIDERSIEDLLVFDFTDGFVGFLDDPVNRGASHTLLLSVVHLENLFKALNVATGLLKVVQETLLKFLIRGFLCHGGQSLYELLFRVVNILKLVNERQTS